MSGRHRVLLIGVLAVAGCIGGEPPPKRPAHVAFSHTTHDFGRIAQGTAVEHDFPFVNQGGTALTVMDLREACDCYAQLVNGPEVPPGGSAIVRIRCDTRALYGPQRRTVTVYSNDPQQRAILLALDGDVALDVAAEPAQVYLGSVPPGVSTLRTVALLSGDGARFAAPAATDLPQLRTEVIDTPDGPALAIGTTPDAPLGPFTGTVRVPTTSARRPVVPIEVAGTIAADAPIPTIVNGGRDNGGAPPPAGQTPQAAP